MRKSICLLAIVFAMFLQGCGGGIPENIYDPIFDAVQSGNDAKVKELIASGSDPSYEVGGLSMLFYAVDEKHTEVVRVLVEAKANLSVKDGTGLNILDFASSKLRSTRDEKEIEVYDEIVAILTEGGATYSEGFNPDSISPPPTNRGDDE